LTSRAADLLVGLAGQVGRLPSLSGALASGQIDVAKARVFGDELAGLPDSPAELIVARLLLAVPKLTTGQIRSRLRRAVLAFDPEAARERQQKAKSDARVESWAEPSGNAGMAGRELDEAGVIAADRRLTAIAAWLRGRGAAGTTTQLRAAAYLCLLLGKPIASLLPGDHDQDGGPVDPGSPLAAGGDPPVSGAINLTLPLASWLGLAGRPGQVAGYGPAPAWTCRDLAQLMTQSPATRYCLTLTTPGGHAAGHACTTTPPPSRASPGLPDPAWPGPDPPPGRIPAGLAAWLAGLHIEWLATGTCEHRRETPGYRPAAKLAHLVKTRNPTCTAPGCRRPASQSDLDHIQPYEQGGRTCECNLHTPCRRHHRLKGTAGWHAEMTTPGVITWTLPHGRTYTTTPEPYPV
jgi:hypothetical protein